MNNNEKWEALLAEVNRRGGNGEDFVSALRELYSVYSDDVLVWLAKLYDPKVGGFYYSNSARDNETVEFRGARYKLLPDIESTNQAINFLVGYHIIEDEMQLPEKMREQMKDFMCRCLDPESGFFYHPQWPKELTDSKPSRRGRDLMWAENMAERFGFSYPCPTANERLKEKSSDEENVAGIPEYLRSREKLIAYLEHFNWDDEPYRSGNELSAQVMPIDAAGLTDVVVNYLNYIQNQETGMWGKRGGYEAVNGYMKITCFYTRVGRIIPNAGKAAVSMMESLISNEPVQTPCFQFNGWFAVQNILKTLRSLGDEGNRQADEIVKKLMQLAPEAIRATKRKVLIFKKPDGSFSQLVGRTSETSQGMPVAIPLLDEGDINSNNLCTSTVLRLMAALELNKFAPPIFSENAYSKFLENLRLD